MLDQIIKQVGGQFGLGDKGGDLMALVTQHLQGQGGLQGLISNLQEKGLGEQAASWVGTGENQPMSAEQAQNALGPDFIQDAASKLGVQPDQVSGAVAGMMPDMVDKMTPGGNIPEGFDLASAAQGLLGGKMPDLGGMLGGLLGGNK